MARLTLCACSWWGQLFLDTPASVDKVHRDCQKDQEDDSGKLENVHVPSPRLWLVGEGGRSRKSVVGSTTQEGGVSRNGVRASRQKVQYNQGHVESRRDDRSGV